MHNVDKSDVDKLLEEIKRNRTELKHFIEASEVKILLKIEELNARVKALEKENEFNKNKIEFIERNLKKNTLLIYGLELEDDYTIEDVCENLGQLLEITISREDINDCIQLNIPNNPIKLELISFLKKREIFKNCTKLKGTQIGITNDLTYKQRQENKILKKHLEKARQNKNQKSFIRGNRLVIGEEQFTVEVLENLTRNKLVPSSEPSTPTNSTNHNAFEPANSTHDQSGQNNGEASTSSLLVEEHKQTPNIKTSTNNKKILKQISNTGNIRKTSTFTRARLRSQNKP